MDNGQAVSLLSIRLGPIGEHDGSAAQLQLLRWPRSELLHWPLAVELAAAYLHGGGLGITGIPEYLRRLKLRSLGDYRSIPPGYPRTLIKAIGLCLERIRSRPTGPGTRWFSRSMDGNPLCRLHGRAAYPRVHPYVGAPDGPDDTGHRQFLVDDPDCLAPEVVTILRAASLVRVDELLSADRLNRDNDRLYDRIDLDERGPAGGHRADSTTTRALLDTGSSGLARREMLQQAHGLGAHSRSLILTAHAEPLRNTPQG